ncbi:single-stranded-DNA-specific exonuclease RecJ [Dokdonella sp.]|uniref:single-stranded-DNA-specific exonuclease RecJ n=1 Tax=Dokdonella sp. TaxID=2291710 RepID=UPI0025B7C996|nr:single-stranded-DNA-specific exonuclease RecJ [Dokdonella sp.]MBX3693206.1 single-stranded-DNA-specific exonuclease RecJ [Dokdonella sp.]
MRPIEIRQRESAGVVGGWPEHVHPVLHRVYAQRGIVDPREVEHRLGALASPDLLGGIDTACDMLEHAITHERRITIVGDFDCDGATGTAVAVRGLRLLGAKHVDFRVPNRVLHGYGLSPALVATLDPRPDLVVTVDNGIASHAGIDAARARGIDVLVTDHHLPAATLPAARAIVNPNIDGDAFPSKALAGVGVMFCLLIALRARMRVRRAFAAGAEPDLSALLDLVALGTVADLVPLDFNNRILVEAGLRRIRSRRACAGIQALLDVAGRDPTGVVAADLGYVLGPRINAAGRLEDMAIGIECLLSDDVHEARILAARLSAINAERRDLQDTMVEQGEAVVARWIAQHGSEALPFGVTLFDDDWHAGVVGLVASKLKERLHRPVVACAPAGDGSDEVRGSARSIRGVHVRDLLAEVDARCPGLIRRFGGHAMAAGLSLARADVARFAAEFDAVVRERTARELFDPVLYSDGELEPADICLELAQQLRAAGPWGQGFAEPLFDNVFELDSWRIVGGRHWRLDLRLPGCTGVIEAILFNAEAGSAPPPRFRAAYQLDVNEWNGRQRVQLVVRHLQAA